MDPDLEHRLLEVDRMLNDPDTQMHADRVWSLLAEISAKAGADTERPLQS